MPNYYNGQIATEIEYFHISYRKCHVCGYTIKKFKDKKLEEKIWNLHMVKHQPRID